MKKEIKIYNIILPMYLLWLVPVVWLIALPANFFIDLAVIVLTMKRLKVPDLRINAKCSILKVWVFGFLSDFVGAGCMLLFQIFDSYESVFAFAGTALAVCISALCIYKLNSHFSFGKTSLNKEQVRKISIALAVFTAPYFYFVPIDWLYY